MNFDIESERQFDVPLLFHSNVSFLLQCMEVLKLHPNDYKVDTSFKGASCCRIPFFCCLLCLYETCSLLMLLFPLKTLIPGVSKVLLSFFEEVMGKGSYCALQFTYVDLTLYCHQNSQSCPIQHLCPVTAEDFTATQ